MAAIVNSSPRHPNISARTAQRCDQLIDFARRLIAVPSPNPPGSTQAVAAIAAELIRSAVPDADVEIHASTDEISNVVARVRGDKPGRRIVLNGHLDTYPLGTELGWRFDPLGGVVKDGRLYGRGAADMKGGIAASMIAFAVLAEHRDLWSGEVVLTLGGDEESMGPLGTRYLMDNVPCAIGDAAIIGDAGSPRVLRFGEKGFIWIEINAVGKAAHGAHVHLGCNAIDRLRSALDALSGLESLSVTAPVEVADAIAVARSISEPLSGAGESETLSRITVNVGKIDGGVSPNLIPATARAAADVRLPIGITTAEAEAYLQNALGAIEGVSWHVFRQFEPNFTHPSEEIVTLGTSVAQEVLGAKPAINMRVGASDARWFRMAGIPTIVYGPTPYNMGGADEYALVSDLDVVAQVHALTAFRFLCNAGR